MASSENNRTEIEQVRAQLEEKERLIQSQAKRIEFQVSRIEILEEVVRHLKIKRFTPSSEKTSQGQFLLFDEAELVTDPDVITHEQDKKPAAKSTPSAPRGRKPFAADLRRAASASGRAICGRSCRADFDSLVSGSFGCIAASVDAGSGSCFVCVWLAVVLRLPPFWHRSHSRHGLCQS